MTAQEYVESIWVEAKLVEENLYEPPAYQIHVITGKGSSRCLVSKCNSERAWESAKKLTQYFLDQIKELEEDIGFLDDLPENYKGRRWVRLADKCEEEIRNIRRGMK